MKRLFTLFSVFLFTSMLAVGQTGGTGPEDDFDGDGVKNIDDLDSNNDGILDSYERQIDDSKTITDVFQINGDAVLLDEENNEIRLTPDLNNKAGQMWSYSKVDFSKDFTISIKVYLGTNDSDGADGIAIVFQNDPDGVNATGQDGEGLGAKGIENGIVLELDTWKNNNKYGDIDDDHGSIERSIRFSEGIFSAILVYSSLNRSSKLLIKNLNIKSFLPLFSRAISRRRLLLSLPASGKGFVLNNTTLSIKPLYFFIILKAT